jgi:hypothetical protein
LIISALAVLSILKDPSSGINFLWCSHGGL